MNRFKYYQVDCNKILGVTPTTDEYYPIELIRITESGSEDTIAVLEHNVFNDLNSKSVYFRQFDVVPLMRDNGLGLDIITEIVNNMITGDFYRVKLEANNSEGFWSKCGFVPTGEMSNDNIVMEYILKK